jgi:hypothetical protein
MAIGLGAGVQKISAKPQRRLTEMVKRELAVLTTALMLAGSAFAFAPPKQEGKASQSQKQVTEQTGGTTSSSAATSSTQEAGAATVK